MNFLKIILPTFFLLLAVTFLAFYFGTLRFNYPSKDAFPVSGIDVSHHQGDIDWKTVGQQDIKFVFIKATEGATFVDKKFAENWAEAQANGLDVGAYHFFTFCKSGEEQARNFMAVVPVDSNSLPPVIDLEYGGNCQLKRPKSDVLQDLQIFEKLVAKYYQKRPIFYVTEEFYQDFLLEQDFSNPIWLRDIYEQPTLPDGKQWLLWQYANRGKIDGIDTYVDWNVFKGSLANYEQFRLQ